MLRKNWDRQVYNNDTFDTNITFTYEVSLMPFLEVLLANQERKQYRYYS